MCCQFTSDCLRFGQATCYYSDKEDQTTILTYQGMNRGPLFNGDYRPHFSGHETFPLRYGWLKKAVDTIGIAEGKKDNVSVFTADDAIARFGVGKNMVASIRHWAIATGIVEEVSGRPKITPLGRLLFDDDGLDPYMENPSTAWLIHWQLCSHPAKKTTWYWTFNHYPALSFERDGLVRSIVDLVKECEWPRASRATIKNDVACFIRTYLPRRPSGRASHEEALESPLTELGLIRVDENRHGLRFGRGRKASLGSGVFCYAVSKFWRTHSSRTRTLSFEALSHEPGCPGRVFQLDENDLIDRFNDIEETSNGLFAWSETAGQKQLVRNFKFKNTDATTFIKSDYGS